MLTGFLFRNTGRAVKTICNLARFLNLDMDFLDPTVDSMVWYGSFLILLVPVFPPSPAIVMGRYGT